MTTQHAVEVTIDSGFTNVPPTVFVSYVRMTSIHGNPTICDQYGYAVRVSPDCVRDLGYDATFSIVDGKLVAVQA